MKSWKLWKNHSNQERDTKLELTKVQLWKILLLWTISKYSIICILKNLLFLSDSTSSEEERRQIKEAGGNPDGADAVLFLSTVDGEL